MNPTNGHPRSSLLEAIELNRLRKAVVQPTPWTQAKPQDLLVIRRSDLDLFLSRISVRDSQSRMPLPTNDRVAKIQQLVADAFLLEMDELLSQRRPERITWPRQIAVYLARKFTDCSLNDLASQFGFRAHKTVMYACTKVQSRMETEPKIRTLVEFLQDELDCLGVAKVEDKFGSERLTTSN
jgi:Bacterial dnaA protein helix-turn-helix